VSILIFWSGARGRLSRERATDERWGALGCAQSLMPDDFMGITRRSVSQRWPNSLRESSVELPEVTRGPVPRLYSVNFLLR
jgi:hypothetical protein